ncbi:transposase [Mesorhizobium sp. B2-1-1]|uniref:transposase n=1 Tax=Mesorhizobium sp. B2-1-1 TaxID=2589974 RepID=UPI001D00AD7A|nr:transposase [Mesorhizobium sp. B2-1-1]
MFRGCFRCIAPELPPGNRIDQSGNICLKLYSSAIGRRLARNSPIRKLGVGTSSPGGRTTTHRRSRSSWSADYLFNKRWPGGFTCPCCDSGKAWRLEARPWLRMRRQRDRPGCWKQPP